MTQILTCNIRIHPDVFKSNTGNSETWNEFLFIFFLLSSILEWVTFVAQSNLKLKFPGVNVDLWFEMLCVAAQRRTITACC